MRGKAVLRLLQFMMITGLVAASGLAQKAVPVPKRLVQTTPAQLVNCAPVTPVGCMSAGFTPSDDEGHAAPVELPAGKQLAAALTVQAGDAGTLVHPFYASTGAGSATNAHANVILLMIDISGSMNDPSPGSSSRFAAVKDALTRYVAAMDEGVDEIAIVPFESHSVVPTIRSAVFSNQKADLKAQLDALPQPGPKNNTALYQAVFTGVETLKSEVSLLERDGHAASDLQPHLILMTDGKNEVAPGDDAQLLNGPLGLQQAAEQVATSHLDVVGVGFGDRAAIDAASMQRLSTRFLYAADATELLNALHVTRVGRSHAIEMTWLLQEPDRIALTGRDQVWNPTLTLGDGTVLHGEPIHVTMPATAPPIYERAAGPAELEALIAAHPPANSGWSTLLVHLLLFLGVAALLLMLWFWVPKLVWGQGYLNQAPPPARWSSDRPVMTSASGVQIRPSNLPSGFTNEPVVAAPLQRSAAQVTQVGPRPEASRTRISFDD